MADERDRPPSTNPPPPPPPDPEPAPNARHVTVCSTRKPNPDGSNDTILFERDAAHPEGEAFVAGPKPVTVGRTSEVERLLRDGALRECDPADAKSKKAPGQAK
jgi:hypothetical protein